MVLIPLYGKTFGLGKIPLSVPMWSLSRIQPLARVVEFFQFASVGGIPQDLKFEGEETFLEIGDKTVIREFVTINRGTGLGGGLTKIGRYCLLMAYAHVAHDCILGDNDILANCATLAGHVILGEHVTVGGLTAVQQFVRIGDFGLYRGTFRHPKRYTAVSENIRGRPSEIIGN